MRSSRKRGCAASPESYNRLAAWLAKPGFPCHTDLAPLINESTMFQSPSRMVGCLLLALVASGCVSTNAYVENGHDKADFRELKPRKPPTPVKVIAEFRINGEPHPEVNNAVFNVVVRVLQRTAVLQPVSGDPGLTLRVIVDDTVDLDEARRSGLMTGLTEGLTGSITRDEYHFTYTMQSSASEKPQTGLYRHAMITVSGRAVPPSYGQPHSSDEAFDIIVKQSVLEFLYDLQSIGTDEPVMLIPETSDGK